MENRFYVMLRKLSTLPGWGKQKGCVTYVINYQKQR